MFKTKFLLFANFFVTISCLMKSKSMFQWLIEAFLVLTLDHEQLGDMKPLSPIKLKRNVADITRIDPVVFRYKKNFMSQFSRAMFNRNYQWLMNKYCRFLCFLILEMKVLSSGGSILSFLRIFRFAGMSFDDGSL